MLSPAEREIVITRADDEHAWHVFTESTRAAGKRLLRIAKALGIAPEPNGQGGYEFDLPEKAISFKVPRKGGPGNPGALAKARASKSLRPDSVPGPNRGS